MSLENELAAPVELPMGDCKIVLSPLKLRDMAAFRREAEQRARNIAEGRLRDFAKAEALTPELRIEIVRDLHAALASGLAEAQFAREYEGTAYLVWLSAKRTDATITHDWVMDNIDWKNVDTIQSKIDEISYPNRKAQDATTITAADLGEAAAKTSGEGSSSVSEPSASTMMPPAS